MGTKNTKSDNSYVVGDSGTGKTNFIFGVIINELCNRKKFENIVVIDSGRSYEGLSGQLFDSQYIALKNVNEVELSPVELSMTRFTVFELEELNGFIGDTLIEKVIDNIKLTTHKNTLLIIDEWWRMNPKVKQWALTEFEGNTLVSIMSENDITVDNTYHLFDNGIELSRPNQKKSQRLEL